MIRRIFIAVVVLHGLIHLMGFAKGFGLAELSQLTQPISRAMGAVWLGAALLMLGTAVALVIAPRWWWAVGAIALIVSQIAILGSWHDAWYGTLANAIVLVGALYGVLALGPWSLHAAYERAVAHAPPVAARAVLTDEDLAPLPAPVQRYVRAAGVIGKPKVHDFHATWTGRIRASATAPWMTFVAEQHNTIDPPRRFFMMDARMKGLPVAVLHAFGAEGATMRVKLLSAFGMVNAAGADLTRAETVTLFNDLCLFAPGALVSPAIAWEPIDDRAARARFTLGANTISAELRFDAGDQLVDFVSDDRGAASTDGRTFTAQRWTTPVRDYAQVGPARVATHGEARWHPATGEYAYGEFDLTSLAYDVAPRA
ncbi:MAG: hypothetical protein K8W52_23560 [Deltaproteobacteria bacterium]|nr:hypothetical protein [Deltaproteobacteria bacterium]